MRRSGASALLAILVAGVSIRLSPLLTYLYWGADIGEYHSILRDLTASGSVSTEYVGWGVTYPFFPGVFFLQGAGVALAGLDVPVVLSLLVPTLGALVALPVFLLAARLSRETKVALFAAAFVAVAMPHAYSTSHAAPSTLGDLLVFSGFLLFIRIPRDPKAVLPALLVSGALIVTHHLATYFLLILVLVSIVLRALLRPHPAEGARRQATAYGVVVASTFAFWFGSATSFRDGILRDVNVSPWWLLPAAFPVGLLLLLGLVRARRRIAWRYRPRHPSLARSIALYAGTIGFIVALMVYGMVAGVPGTTIRLPGSVVVVFAPLFALLALSASGRRFTDFWREGHAVNGPILALVLSAGFGALAAPHVVIPYRHIEYLVVFLGILAGVGLFRMLDLRAPRPGRRAGAIAAVGLLFVATGVSALPPPDLFAGWNEGTRASALDGAYWSRAYVDGLLAADHRTSTIAFGFGDTNATWDAARSPFLAETFLEAWAGLLDVRAPSGPGDVTFVWIDEDTERGVQLLPWEPAVPMTPAAIAKFSEAPFAKVFDNGYARIYWFGALRPTFVGGA
ncbi:MAG TPA: hypothetical protein VJ300_05540 [Thermoplasmata archaeon]|nr:hypothetical protein [Thermoplasmata archaeon]